jgi:hypothetical protein
MSADQVHKAALTVLAFSTADVMTAEEMKGRAMRRGRGTTVASGPFKMLNAFLNDKRSETGPFFCKKKNVELSINRPTPSIPFEQQQSARMGWCNCWAPN